MSAMSHILSLVTSKRGAVVLSSAVSLAVGAVGGYFFARQRLEEEYAEISQKEIAEAQVFYRKLNKQDEFATVESAVETLHGDDDVAVEEATTALRSYQGIEPNREKLEPQTRSVLTGLVTPAEEVEATSVTIVNNVFTDGEPITEPEEFDYTEEMQNRDPERPYIITYDEFMEAEPGYSQVSLTYFSGDDVLVDSRDDPINDVENTIGEDTLQKFGHGSGNNNVVYVRNEVLDLDFEVAKATGSYLEAIGLKHSDDPRPRIRKFRTRYDE